MCHQYWPEQGIESYGEFTIESGGQEVHDGYTTRTLYLAAAKVGVATVDRMAVCVVCVVYVCGCGCVEEAMEMCCSVTSSKQLQSTLIHQVTQFHITNWTPDGVCANLATITDVIEEVDKVQKRTGNHPLWCTAGTSSPSLTQVPLDHVRSHDASSSPFQ